MTSPEVERATVCIAAEDFDAGRAEVTGDAYRHLFRARRLALGDTVRVVDGEGRARLGRIAEVGRAAARIELGELQPGREAARRLTLVAAAPRPERASWLVEKATELGVARIAWLDCERASRRVSAALLARHRRVATAALEQCGGATLPAISGPHDLDELGRIVDSIAGLRVLDPAGASRPAPLPAAGELGLVVGPEGGWSEGERTLLASLGGVPWSLGERILRVETAAVVGAALILAAAPAA